MSRYTFAIDPGVNTGLSLWDGQEKRLIFVDSVLIHVAMERIIAYVSGAKEGSFYVIFEDARQRKWYGKQAGTHALQGAGSIKRDCKIWEDFLTEKGIPFTMRAPGKGMTKLTAERFKALTGWKERTNEHSRDAAMLIFGK